MGLQSNLFMFFLAVSLCLYFAVPSRLRLWVLLAANAAFFLWADAVSGVWLLFSIVSTWGCALLVQRLTSGGARRLLAAACLLLNFGLLAAFRYFPVWESLINANFGHGLAVVRLDVAGRMNLAAPIGISFYTLQAAGYLLDTASGKYGAQRNLGRYAAFVSFFPNISSGPIERGGHFLPQLESALTKTRRELLDYDRIVRGATGILLGFFMKLVIADRAAVLVDHLFGMYADGNSFTMLMAALFYSVQLYCDFASYSCIAAGAAALFGFSLLENFRQPYFAAGISDFWRRWHISLSSWLRDYIYIPLGGNRKGRLRKYANLLAVFLVSGLWHGGAPTFLAWGLLHGLFLVAEDALSLPLKRWGKGRRLPFRRTRRLLGSCLTFLIVTCLWIPFRSETLSMAWICLKNLFTRWQGFALAGEFLYAMGLDRTEFWIAIGAILLLFVMDLVSERTGKGTAAWMVCAPLPVRWGLCLILVLAVFIFGRYGTGYDAAGFIYLTF